jgi:hypothetical protein
MGGKETQTLLDKNLGIAIHKPVAWMVFKLTSP